MIHLFSNKHRISIENEVVVFEGSPIDMNEGDLRALLLELKITRTIFRKRFGGQERDLIDTASWIKWFALQNLRRFEKQDIMARFSIKILRDKNRLNLNIVLVMSSFNGGGSISHRSFIQRLSIDDFVCFE